MIVRLAFAIFACVATLSASFTKGVAETVPAGVTVSTDRRGNTDIAIPLSEAVPFRVFTVDAPDRLVVDFRGLSEAPVSVTPLPENGAITAVRVGVFAPGWVRLVADLAGPVEPRDITLHNIPTTNASQLDLTLAPVGRARFAKISGIPDGVVWPQEPESAIAPRADAEFVVVIDPGHGGVDPGAERGGVSEKALMLDLSHALADKLAQTPGVDAILTREDDRFVSLDARVALAQTVGADLFMSLHADALSDGGAQGATVYTLSETASDIATAQLAARHNRSDLLAGVDLLEADDGLTQVLLDIARRQTAPRSDAFAEALIASFEANGVPLNRRPRREAGFSVLKSADIPSVLVEVGFLSSARDLANLQDPVWQALALEALSDAILTWRADSKGVAQAPLQ